MEDQPRKLGRYELREILGRGAMGVVYKAYDSFLDRIVAVKTYRADAAMGEQVRRRFEREVRTASKLAHPNIVMVFDGGLEDDTPYLAMEFVDGPTLDAEMRRRGRLPVGEALAIVLGVAEGLAYAHHLGVVHRDIKPANILLSAAGLPKVSDFGVAKVMTAGTAASTMAIGTPSYMSPEQIEGKSLDARADVFGLAVLAYELLAGQRPFVADNLTAVLFQIMHSDAPPPSATNPALPAAVDAVFARALAKDVARRTADALTFAAELRAAFEAPEVAMPAAPEREAELETRRFVPRAGAPATSDQPAAAAKSHRGWWIALVVGVLGVIGGVAGYMLGGGANGLIEWPRAATSPSATPTVAPPPTVVPIATSLPQPTTAPVVAPVVEATAGEVSEPTVAPSPTSTPTRRPRVEPTAIRTPAPKPTRAPTPPGPPDTATLPLVAPPLPPGKSNLVVEIVSDPPGAEVLMNGVSKGQTPARITDIEPGSYDVEVRKEGYASFKKTARFSANSEYSIRMTLGSGAAKGFIAVTSQPPGAKIRINGADSGRTPATFGLTSGRYTIAVEQEGYATQERTVDLKDGETHQLSFRFGSGQVSPQ
jgi:tRNA A-37 threonylcarbamoyl transferase component Bud32